jgi:hypothetical protein
VKEFLQAITHFNPKIIELVVQGVSVFIIEKMMAKMLNLPKTGITKLPTKVGQGKGQGKKKGKGGNHLLENHFTKNTCQPGRMEGFSFQGNVCS